MNSWCSDALVCLSAWSVAGDYQSASQSDADRWPKAWMLYLWLSDRHWQTLLEFMVQFTWMWCCPAQPDSGLPDSIPNAADIRMLTTILFMPECQVWSIAACTLSSNQLTVHVTVNALPGSNWCCCQAPTQLWTNGQTGGHRSVCCERAHTLFSLIR